jgi:hypothetical protein
MKAYKDQFLSDIYVGWAQGFLDGERKKLEDTEEMKTGTIKLGHPATQIISFAELLGASQESSWYD